MSSDIIISPTPMIILDNAGVQHKFILVESGSGEQTKYAGFSVVEVTGSAVVTSSFENPVASLVSPKIPTGIRKKTFSNKNQDFNLIDWENNSSGSFRIAEYDPDRKLLIIFNDSSQDLFLSVANDENPKIILDFENQNDIENLSLQYHYTNDAGEEVELFNYSYEDIKNIYSYYSFSEEPGKHYGYNKNYLLSTVNNNKRVIIYLGPDYTPNVLNKHNISNIGVFTISIQGTSKSTDFEINKSNNTYDIYALIGDSIVSDSITYRPINNNYRNGFKLNNIINKTIDAPQEYSYILYTQQTISIEWSEAYMTYFGYLLKPSDDVELTIRVTEAR